MMFLISLSKKQFILMIKSLIDKGILLIQEELKEKFKPKIESFVRITDHADQ